jgi:hypothetical protein
MAESKTLFKLVPKDTKVFTVVEDDDDDGIVLWKCYSCGIDSEKGTFRTDKWWTDCGYEYDCICNTCESDNTAMDGEGAPSCDEHDNYDWYCDKCRKTMCAECWKWFDTPDGEPEEYICAGCDVDPNEIGSTASRGRVRD